MLQLIKHFVLYFYFLYVRFARREKLIQLLAPTGKKRDIDIPEIPATLDDIKETLNGWHNKASFVAFDGHGTCVRIKAERSTRHGTVISEFDLPGYGHFRYQETVQYEDERRENNYPLFGGSRIKIFCIEPMRRWKLCFRGPLEHIEKKDTHVHANILLYWECLSDPYDHFMTPSCWKLAGTLSCLSWRDLRTLPAFDDRLCYEQWGELRGRIEIENNDRLNVRLKSIRERDFERKSINATSLVCKQHFVLKDSGLAFSQQTIRFKDETVYSGFVTFPIGDSHPTTLLASGKPDDAEHHNLQFPHDIRTCNMSYKINKKLYKPCFNVSDSGVSFHNLTINDRMGFGLQVFENNDTVLKANENEIYTASEHKSENNDSLSNLKDIVNLNEKVCTMKSLVGGKACQLSALMIKGGFNVPEGVCITTNAMTKHVVDNQSVVKAADALKDCLKSSKIDSLREKCDAAVNIFIKTEINSQLRADLENQLIDVFGKNGWKTKKFAVRSSSISEDSSETSAAGQFETFLGIEGLDNILSAILDCWASSFAYPVVEYRRQNGQELIESMGVIVQEMVDAEVSGVIFTADPSTGNESVMVINATYGLGEAVVSGEVTPDTITVKRCDKNDFQVVKVQSGSKEKKRIIDNTYGVKTEMLSEDERRELCMKEDSIYRVCEVSTVLESSLGSALDIEWSLSNGKVYVLQARPITTLDMETDEDLIKEFDSPVVSEKELVTSCNIQEMMPGAVSTLTGDLFIRAVNRAIVYSTMSRLGLQLPVHPLNVTFTQSGLSFFNLTQCACGGINGIGGEKAKSGVEMHVIGHPVEGHDIDAIKDFVGRPFSCMEKILRLIREFITLKKHDTKMFESLREKTHSFDIGRNTNTAVELYKCIDESLLFYFEMWLAYIFKAGESGSWASIIMAIMKGDSKDVTLEHMSDMALILSDCQNVVSAQIPEAIQNIAERIVESNLKDEFLGMSIDICDNYLKNCKDDNLRSDYIKFMEQHGHRGIREADFIEPSWSQDPSKLMETLKSIVSQNAFDRRRKSHRSPDEIVDALQTKLTRFQKWIFKRSLVRNAMDGVAARELGKSYMIKVTDIFKRAYWRLAYQMVQESRLPEPDLMFFLTHREIGELLHNRSARLVRLAKRRKRVFPERNKITYPQINFGLPQPIKTENEEHHLQPSFTLQGMPVCRGKAEGKARVIKSLKDADELKEGDVMICRFTDVGWSPYFPLISGLVTELGGLLSHGAVVARECGIPCIVSTPAATDLIQTGDHVVLDGTAGTISKIERHV